jgi:hypothetical protein
VRTLAAEMRKFADAPDRGVHVLDRIVFHLLPRHCRKQFFVSAFHLFHIFFPLALPCVGQTIQIVRDVFFDALAVHWMLGPTERPAHFLKRIRILNIFTKVRKLFFITPVRTFSSQIFSFSPVNGDSFFQSFIRADHLKRRKTGMYFHLNAYALAAAMHALWTSFEVEHSHLSCHSRDLETRLSSWSSSYRGSPSH